MRVGLFQAGHAVMNEAERAAERGADSSYGLAYEISIPSWAAMPQAAVA
jgi:hypothetical protein